MTLVAMCLGELWELHPGAGFPQSASVRWPRASREPAKERPPRG